MFCPESLGDTEMETTWQTPKPAGPRGRGGGGGGLSPTRGSPWGRSRKPGSPREAQSRAQRPPHGMRLSGAAGRADPSPPRARGSGPTEDAGRGRRETLGPEQESAGCGAAARGDEGQAAAGCAVSEPGTRCLSLGRAAGPGGPEGQRPCTETGLGGGGRADPFPGPAL